MAKTLATKSVDITSPSVLPTVSPDVPVIELSPRASTSKIQTSSEVMPRKVSHTGLPQMVLKEANRETEKLATGLSSGVYAEIQTMSSEESIALPTVSTCGSSNPVLLDITEEKSELPDSSTRMSAGSPDYSSLLDSRVPLMKIKKEKVALDEFRYAKDATAANKTDLDEEEGELLSDFEEDKCNFCDKVFKSTKENNAHVLKEHFMEVNDIWTDLIDAGL